MELIALTLNRKIKSIRTSQFWLTCLKYDSRIIKGITREGAQELRVIVGDEIIARFTISLIHQDTVQPLDTVEAYSRVAAGEIDQPARPVFEVYEVKEALGVYLPVGSPITGLEIDYGTEEITVAVYNHVRTTLFKIVAEN